MAFFRVVLRASAAKELRGIPKKDLARIVEKLQELAGDPRPRGSERLSGEDRYRLHHGDWRVVYGIDDHEHEVLVVKIGHRREVYR